MPLVEIYAPEQRGTEWCVAARVNLPQGSIKILASAPQALVASAMAKAAGMFAYHKAGPMVGAARPEIMAEAVRQYQAAQAQAAPHFSYNTPPPAAPTTPTGKPKLMGAAVAQALSPRFHDFKQKIAQVVPYAGPALEAGIDAPVLQGAVAVAASPEPQPAPATTDPGALSRASAALDAANAALGVTDGNADAAANLLASLKSALELLQQATAGLEAAQDKIAELAYDAATGSTEHEEALAYLAALWGYYSEPYREAAPTDWAGPDYEIDEDVAGKLRISVGGPDVAVGAASDLLRSLDLLSQVKQGYRY